MDAYEEACVFYHHTIQYTSGGGSCYQPMVDDAYAKLQVAYANLPPETRATFSLPVKHKVRNDGFGGVFAGLSLIVKHDERK